MLNKKEAVLATLSRLIPEFAGIMSESRLAAPWLEDSANACLGLAEQIRKDERVLQNEADRLLTQMGRLAVVQKKLCRLGSDRSYGSRAELLRDEAMQAVEAARAVAKNSLLSFVGAFGEILDLDERSTLASLLSQLVKTGEGPKLEVIPKLADRINDFLALWNKVGATSRVERILVLLRGLKAVVTDNYEIKATNERTRVSASLSSRNESRIKLPFGIFNQKPIEDMLRKEVSSFYDDLFKPMVPFLSAGSSGHAFGFARVCETGTFIMNPIFPGDKEKFAKDPVIRGYVKVKSGSEVIVTDPITRLAGAFVCLILPTGSNGFAEIGSAVNEFWVNFAHIQINDIFKDLNDILPSGDYGKLVVLARDFNEEHGDKFERIVSFYRERYGYGLYRMALQNK